MKYNPIIELEEFKTERGKSDPEVWSDYEVFEELRNRIPIQNLVSEIVEFQFTHPNNWHNHITLQDSIDSVVTDYVHMVTPNGISCDIEKKFLNDVRDEINKYAESVYENCIEDADKAETVSLIQDIIEREINKTNISKY